MASRFWAGFAVVALVAVVWLTRWNIAPAGGRTAVEVHAVIVDRWTGSVSIVTGTQRFQVIPAGR